MSATAFLAFFVLACDFAAVVLFRWLFGEKRPKHSRRSANGTQAMTAPSRYNSIPTSGKAALPLNGNSSITRSPQAANTTRFEARLHREERLAHQRIAASFVRSRA